MSRAFDDWKQEAYQADLLQTAQAFGAQLKRKGQEWTGPCPACGGTDRFAINVVKVKWNCRGAEGGRSPIGMVMHIAGLSYIRAIEEITGRPNPNGGTGPLTPEQEAERVRRAEWLAAQNRHKDAKRRAYLENTAGAARAIWGAGVPVDGPAAAYLESRGLKFDDYPDVLRFHPLLPYPNRKSYPALICRVDDVDGIQTAVWRIFLRADGRKADVENAKLGLGPAGGGAVRIGGLGPRIGIAEGVESALSAWNLIGRKYPVWASLSTAGMQAVELPIEVQHVVIFSDGDKPLRKKEGQFVTAVPAGRMAAQKLRARLLQEGVGVTIAAEPPAGKDFNDLWLEQVREVA